MFLQGSSRSSEDDCGHIPSDQVVTRGASAGMGNWTLNFLSLSDGLERVMHFDRIERPMEH